MNLLKNIKKSTKFYIIISVIILLGSIGVTYSIIISGFNAINIESTASEIDASISYSDNSSGSTITSNGNMLPISDDLITGPSVTDTRVVKATFGVTGNSNNPSNSIYDIALRDIVMDCELATSDLKWRLYKGSELINEGSLSPTFDAMNGDRIVLTNTQEDLTSNTDNYTFLLWISESCTGDVTQCDPSIAQNKYLNKTFSGTIKVELATGSKKVNTRVTGSEGSCSYIETDVPVCNSLTYSGSAQTIVNSGSNYTLLNNSGTKAGTYVVTAKLKDGYKWSDHSTDDRLLYCNINKKDVTVTTLDQAIVYGNGISSGINNINASGLLSGDSVDTVSLKSSIVDVGSGTISTNNIKIEDENGNDVTYNYNVKKNNTGVVTITCSPNAEEPIVEDKVYNGEEQTGISGGQYITLGGVLSATEIGSYTSMATPNKNYCWSDGSTTTKEYIWNIDVLGANLTVSTNSLSLTYPNAESFTYSYNGDGSISCSISNTSVATCSIDTVNKEVVVTPVSVGNATLTLNVSQGTSYDAASKTIPITVSAMALSGSVKITGTNTYGETLTASVTNTNSATLSYQWYYNSSNSTSGGTAISGATSSTYTIGSGLAGKYIYVVVSATKTNYANATWSDITDATNNTTAAVAKATLTSSQITVTSYSGKYDGSAHYATIKSTIGGLTIVSGSSTSYGTTVKTGTVANTSYNLSPSRTNVGTTTVYYKVYSGDYNDYTGSATVTINSATLSGSVKITGTNTYGQTLTASVTNTNSATLSYQWYYNSSNSTSGGTAISGATNSTYTIGSDLLGKYIYVVVSATKTNYTSATWRDITDVTNNTTAVVVKADASMTVSNSSLSIIYPNDGSFTYTYTGDGTISCSSSSESIATCSVDTTNKKVSVMSAGGTGSTTITLSATEGTNYNAISKTVSVVISYETYTITLSNQSATSAGTTEIYGLYNTGIYLDSSQTNEMTTSANPITVPTRTGYTFGGYYTETGGSGTQLISSTGYITSDFTNSLYDSAVTLYAKWTTNIVTVAVYQDGSSAGSMTPQLWQDGTLKYTVRTVSNGVYTFAIVADGTYDIYLSGVDTGKDVIVSGSGSATINLYSLTLYKGTGISSVSGGNSLYFEGDIVSISATASTGYDFTEWTVNLGDSPASTTSADTTVTITQKTTITAKATIKTYTVSYDANGGSGAPSSQTKTYGVDLTLSSTTPTRYGHTFLGWSTSSDATSATYQAEGTYTTNESMTLYAVWQINEIVQLSGFMIDQYLNGVLTGQSGYGTSQAHYISKFSSAFGIVNDGVSLRDNDFTTPISVSTKSGFTGNLRYYGVHSQVHNWIYFNCSDYSNQTADTCEKWRIIGAFEDPNISVNYKGVVDYDGIPRIIRIVRFSPIATIAFHHPSNKCYNSNLPTYYPYSSLAYLLETIYYNGDTAGTVPYYSGSSGTVSTTIDFGSVGIKNDATRNLIVTSPTQYYGGYNNMANMLPYQIQVYEKFKGIGLSSGVVSDVRPVGISLLNLSDYAYAVAAGTHTVVISQYTTTTAANNWLTYKGTNPLGNTYSASQTQYDWFLNRYVVSGSPSTTLLYAPVASTYAIGTANYYDSLAVRPVVSLWPDVQISGIEGDGTISNPYRIVVS